MYYAFNDFNYIAQHTDKMLIPFGFIYSQRQI